MRCARFAAFACLAVGALSTPSTAQVERPRRDGFQILRVVVENQSQLETLVAIDRGSRDVEIWSDRLAVGVIEVRVSPKQKHLLDAAGLKYEVAVEDLQRRMDDLFGQAAGASFFDTYQTYDEHVAFMNDLVAAYPDLAEMHNLGLSVLGQPLWAIRITGPGDGKPGIMYHGAQHGNEIMGSCVVAYMAEYLLTRYDSDPVVQGLVDDVEWFLLPIMNPDGYEAGDRYNARDVDLNRNWGGPGANPRPFSEPETAALRDFFLAHPNVRAHIDFHTYGKLIMWPWGYTDELCVDNGTFDHLGGEMAGLIVQSRGTNYTRGPVYTAIYPVRGGSVDYTYGELAMWTFTFELGYDHAMPTSEIMPTCIEIAPAMMLLSGWISDCNANDIPDAQDIATGYSDDCEENHTPDECEFRPDFDIDGLVDVCDPDSDNDGVPNEEDVCARTPVGTPVNTEGRPLPDTNGNCDIDLTDYWRLEDCLRRSGPGSPPLYASCLRFFDYDADRDVDMADVAVFVDAFTGVR